jgi:hypothetical protein
VQGRALNKLFRESEFIDFNTGMVKIAPMQLQFRMALSGPLQLSDLIRLFQCRIEVWNLGVAVQMLRQIEITSPPSIWSHAAYGLIAIGFPYFEMIGKTLNPKSEKRGTARADFDFGFRDVYQDITTSSGESYDPVEFYNRVRNGLYHLGSTQNGLWMHNDQSISTKDFDIIRKISSDPASTKYYVNPHAMIRTIVAHFPTFIERLKNPATEYDGMRAKFEEFLSDFHEG